MNMPANDISGLGFNNILQGTELFEALQIDPLTVISPMQVSQIQDIAKFVNEFPEALPLIRGAMFKKPAGTDSLVHASRFANLHKQRFEVQEQLKQVEKELSLYE